jgi:hypothetical protein
MQLILVLADKIVHGVTIPFGVCLGTTNILREWRRLFLVAAMLLCGAKPRPTCARRTRNLGKDPYLFCDTVGAVHL